MFGERLDRAARYAELLRTVATVRGLVGPREGERVWSRHLLNCAVVAELLPAQARVVDVGSGAGLPGIPLVLARPDLRMVLLEAASRRIPFLHEVVTELDLAAQVTVVHGRAPETPLPYPPHFAVARAVAPLPRLVSWTMPLVRPSGALLALRGQRAAEEVRAAGKALCRHEWEPVEVLQVGVGVLVEPTTVVRLRWGATEKRLRRSGSPRRGARGRSSQELGGDER